MVNRIGQIGHGAEHFLQRVAVIARFDENAVVRHMLVVPSGFDAHLAAQSLCLVVERVGDPLSDGQILLPIGLFIKSLPGLALALADAFQCGVNDLPLTLVLSWYEQKAVAILLSLLYLGVKNIWLGPSLPAFVSPAVLDLLVKEYGIRPVTTPEADIKAILG